MKKNITDRTIDATLDMLNGMDPKLAAIIHDVPFDAKSGTITQEQKDLWDSLTDEDKKDFITVDGRKYVRKIYNQSKLAKIRRAKDMSQSALAEASGVSVRMIQHYEQGVRDINKAEALTVLRLADALGCEVRDILTV